MSRKKQWTVEMVDEQIKKWRLIREIIERSATIYEYDSYETKVFKLYLKHSSVIKVAEILNQEGNRIKSANGNRKLSTNDISEVIKNKSIEDSELQSLVKKIFNNSKDFINSIFN